MKRLRTLFLTRAQPFFLDKSGMTSGCRVWCADLACLASRKVLGLLLALACSAALLQSAQAVGAGTLDTPKAPSCDITDLNCISQDFKASLNVTQGTIDSEYQQFAEMIAPVLLMAHGGSFEVHQPCLLLASGLVHAMEAYRHGFRPGHAEHSVWY